MSEHYDFHYQPTGSGAISGQQVLEQTEDAINELGDYVNDNIGGAMDVAQQALETAQNAETNAQTALDTANSFSSAIQSAQQDASTALSTAQTAQTTASNANNTAIQASQDASSAVTTANNASGQVSTLSGTVTALGQRVTTAEGNIGQNTSDITALTTRVGTAEGNITTLQNDVSIAMGNASSAMATAGQVKQQAYVFRYSSTALVASSTNSNTLLDNTDNLKVGDKVIDSSGVLFSITAIDSVNSTFTVGSALIDLALDGDVVHTNRNDDVSIPLNSTSANLGVTGGSTNITFLDKNDKKLSGLTLGNYGSSKLSYVRLSIFDKDTNNNEIQDTLEYAYISNNNNAYLRVSRDDFCNLGSTNYKWKSVYAMNYYYGSNNVEFSTKFVTTDTAQTISGAKTFEGIALTLKSVTGEYTVSRGHTSLLFCDKNSLLLSQYKQGVYSGGISYQSFNLIGYDSNGQKVNNSITFSSSYLNLSTAFLKPDTNNAIALGITANRWSDVQTYKVNGLTPSSLGMPMTRDNAIDISSYFTNFNNGETNQYSPTVNGWIYLETTGCNAIHCFCTTTNGLTHYGDTVARPSDGLCYVLFPVLANTVFKCTWYTNSTITLNKAWFIPCQGNV